MRFLLAFAVITASLSHAATANDGLFSEVAMEAVFEKNTKTTAETAEISATDTLTRITGTDSLAGRTEISRLGSEKERAKRCRSSCVKDAGTCRCRWWFESIKIVL